MLDAPGLLDRLLEEKSEGLALLVAFVGAGGKTEAIFALAAEAKLRGLSVLVTTTTAMRDPRLEADRDIDYFLEGLPETPLPPPSLNFLALGKGESAKIHGPDPENFEGLRGHCDLILVEADGSHRLPLKAPADHEPVIPPTSDVVVACVGLDALGKPADEKTIHRLPEFLEATGLGEGRPVDLAALAALVIAPRGAFKGSPSKARRILLLCKGDLGGDSLASLLTSRLAAKETKPTLVAAAALGLPRRRSLRNSEGALVLVRGAGDLATGVLVRLWNAGYKVGALESPRPSAIRRSVAFSEAVYTGRTRVEGIEARRVEDVGDFLACLNQGASIPVLVDPEGSSIGHLEPDVIVDAIMAKKNLGTSRAMAAFVVALGPGFEAGGDVHAVVETNRGHNLARVIWQGRAEPDSGQPGEIGGASSERVLHAEHEGSFKPLQPIGVLVRSGDVIACIINNKESFNVCTKIDGILRGALPADYPVVPGFKVADVDPRAKPEHCHLVSDKSRAIGGAVLEALLARGMLPGGALQRETRQL